MSFFKGALFATKCFPGYHGNPQPSFLGVTTHILGVSWGPGVVANYTGNFG